MWKTGIRGDNSRNSLELTLLTRKEANLLESSGSLLVFAYCYFLRFFTETGSVATVGCTVTFSTIFFFFFNLFGFLSPI